MDLVKLAWRDGKPFVLAIGFILVFCGVMIANEVGGTSEVVSEPYTATYTYCAAWAGAGGQHHCSLYMVGQERRVDTKIHGWFFETTGYKVVN